MPEAHDIIAQQEEDMPQEYQQCVICLSDVNYHPGEPTALPCNHQFHRDCIDNWLATAIGNGCPSCRHGQADAGQIVPPPAAQNAPIQVTAIIQLY